MLQENRGGLSASALAIRLDIPKRTAYNNLRSLQKRQLVINARPIWLVAQSLYEVQDYAKSPSGNNIGLHNLRFVIKLIQKPYWWNQRQNKLMKLKDYEIRPINYGNNPYVQMMDDICFINMYKESIMFIMRKEYKANDPYDCLEQGIDDFMLIYKKLESVCGFQFFKDGIPQVSVKSQHYVKLNDAMAKRFTKAGRFFQVFHDHKLRILVDMSHPRGIEAVDSEFSPQDLDRYVRYTEDIIVNDPLLPSELTKIMGGIIRAQAKITQNQAIFDANMASHIKAVQSLAVAVQKLTEVVSKR
jgi:hypothetical protein